MADYTRGAIKIALLAILVFGAGCNGIVGDESTATPTDTPEFHNQASEYLMTSEEVGDDWEKNQTREPNFDAPTMESGRVINLHKGETELNIVVLVFESPADAESFFEDQRSTYESNEYGVQNQSIGERSMSASVLNQNVVDVLHSNVYVQTHGGIHLTTAKQYAEEQLQKITEDR